MARRQSPPAHHGKHLPLNSTSIISVVLLSIVVVVVVVAWLLLLFLVDTIQLVQETSIEIDCYSFFLKLYLYEI